MTRTGSYNASLYGVWRRFLVGSLGFSVGNLESFLVYKILISAEMLVTINF